MKLKKLSVLLAENNEMDAKVLRMHLEQWYRLEHFDVTDNEPGYRRALENHPIYDIIISDYRISGFSGLLALDIRNQVCRDKPFIIYTSSKNEISAIETIHRGADNYVLKSHNKNLYHVINKAINDKKNEKVNEIILAASVVALKLGSDSTLFDMLYQKLNELLYAKNMYIALYDKHFQGYRFLFFQDEKDDGSRYTGKNTSKSLTEYVRTNGRVLYAPEKVQQDLVEAGKVELVGTVAKEWLGIPLKVGDEVIGVLALQNHGEETVYSPEDIERLEQLAPTLALIIARNVADAEVEKKTRALNDSPAITIITDAAGTIEYINPAFEKITGFEATPLLGKNLSVFNVEKSSVDFYLKMERAMKHKTPFSGEVFSHKRNGSPFWSSVNMSPVKNKTGEVENFIIISEDITEIKLKTKKLHEMLHRVSESDRLKSSFLANLSHEVRTPLNHILGFSELLVADHLSAQEKHEYKNIIYTAGQRLLLFVTNAIELSKLESDAFEIEPKKFNLRALIAKIHAEYQAYIEQMTKKNITFAFVYSKKIPMYLQADEKAVEIIIRNLIDNAVKFTHSGHISVNVGLMKDEKGRNCFEISVSDTGIGIEKDKMELIFKPFRQADDSLTRNYDGAGLGLHVSQKIAGLLGGTIFLKTERNKGSVFTLKIPETAKNPFPSGDTIAIDESDILQTLGNLLSSRLRTQTFVYYGNKGGTFFKLDAWCRHIKLRMVLETDFEPLLHRIKTSGSVAVVFIYITLNPAKYIGTIKALKQVAPDVKVVALMKHSLSVDKNMVLSAGADAVLTRPVDIHEFNMLCFDLFLYDND